MEEDFSFEAGLEKLSKIVEELENEEVSLEESIKKFEEGMKISKNCTEILEKAEMKIKKVLKDGGRLIEEEVDFKN